MPAWKRRPGKYGTAVAPKAPTLLASVDTFSAHQVILINQFIRDEHRFPGEAHDLCTYGQTPRAEALVHAGYLKRQRNNLAYTVTDKFRKTFMSPRPPWETP